MPISDSKRRADKKWRDANLEQVAIRIHKGIRDRWKLEAEKRGLSLAGLIVKAVEKYLAES